MCGSINFPGYNTGSKGESYPSRSSKVSGAKHSSTHSPLLRSRDQWTIVFLKRVALGTSVQNSG